MISPCSAHQCSTMSRKVMGMSFMRVSGVGFLEGAVLEVDKARAGPLGGGGSCEAASGPRSRANEMVSRPLVHSAVTAKSALMSGDSRWSCSLHH